MKAYRMTFRYEMTYTDEYTKKERKSYDSRTVTFIATDFPTAAKQAVEMIGSPIKVSRERYGNSPEVMDAIVFEIQEIEQVGEAL